MNTLLLDITSSTIDWSRAQFALTAIYHWLFVPLTLGLAVIMGIMETRYYKTREPFSRLRKVLAETLWHQLRNGCSHRYHPRV